MSADAARLLSGGLPAFAADPGSAMPSGAELRKLSGSKRSYEPEADAFAASMLSTTLAPERASSVPSPMMRALGGAFAAATSVMDAGSSRLRARGDAPVYSGVMAKPPRTGWTASYDETTYIWSAAREPTHATNGFCTIADVPTLNYYARQAVVLAAAGTLLRQDRRAELERAARLDRLYMFRTAEEFARTWYPLGAIASLPEGGYTGVGPLTSGSRQRLVPYVVSGSARTRNLFSPTLREGQFIYFVTSERAATTSDFVAPSGDLISALSGGAGQPQLAVTGWADDSSAYPLLSTSRADDVDSDVNYTRRQVAVAQVYREKEWDDAAGTWRLRNVAAQEGAQEARASAEGNSLFIDMFECGHVQPVGVVTEVLGETTATDIDAAHRSGDAMARLPIVTYQAGLF